MTLVHVGTVSCDGAEYSSFYIPYSVLATVIYPIGINLLYTVLFWKNHAEICEEKKNKETSPLVAKTALTFLHKPYSMKCFWWEVVDSVSCNEMVGAPWVWLW